MASDTPEIDVVHIAIGNSDNRLTQQDWANYYQQTDLAIRSCADVVHGAYASLPTAPYQNACWAIVPKPKAIDMLKRILSNIAGGFGQGSVAWAPCPAVEFLPGTPGMTNPALAPDAPRTHGREYTNAPDAEETRPGWQWAQILGIKVADHDGWRDDDSPSYYDPIPLTEAYERFGRCTVDTRGFVHNPWDAACSKNIAPVEPTHPLARCQTCRPEAGR